MAGGLNAWDSRFSQRALGTLGIEEVVSRMAREPLYRCRIMSRVHFRPQVDWIRVKRLIVVDRIIHTRAA